MENCEATIKTPPTALYDFPKLIRGGGENKYVYSFTMSSANGGTYEKFQAVLSVLVADLCGEIDIPYISSVDASVNYDPEKRGIDDPLVEGVSKENVYIRSAKLNGKPLDRAWITTKEVTDGGLLDLEMGAEPAFDAFLARPPKTMPRSFRGSTASETTRTSAERAK